MNKSGITGSYEAKLTTKAKDFTMKTKSQGKNLRYTLEGRKILHVPGFK